MNAWAKHVVAKMHEDAARLRRGLQPKHEAPLWVQAVCWAKAAGYGDVDARTRLMGLARESVAAEMTGEVTRTGRLAIRLAAELG